MEGYQLGGRKGRIGGKVQGLRSINGRYKIDRDVKNSRGNGESKELVCMTHGHELRRGDSWREWGYLEEGDKGENWDNCNSIINKIYLNSKINILTKNSNSTFI